MKRVKRPFDEAVIAQTHSALYLMHKYWARKPHNVVARYIEYYTNPGDAVLDPFMGSGVAVIEAVRLGRKAIGNDLSPMAEFITRSTLTPVDFDALQQAFDRISTAIRSTLESFYLVKCSAKDCVHDAITSQVVWKRDPLKGTVQALLKVNCPHCGRQELRKPTTDDLARYAVVAGEPITYFYPKDVKLHPTAKRSVERVDELFVHRALLCLSILLNEIRKEKESRIRDTLLFCFSSSLAQMANLNSIDMREGRKWSSRGWVIPNYWVPRGFLETNVWNGFVSRFEKVLRGKKEAAEFCSSEDAYRLFAEDATKLTDVESNSVDYIFTDPPYGDAVPYFGLSLMWAAWLGLQDRLDFDDEIIISERGDYELELEDYRKKLKEAFREMHRVLKSGGTVTVTFHNREIRVWNALMSAAFEAGLVYENDNYVLPAVNSAKSQLARTGSMTGDIYINLRKPARSKSAASLHFEDVNGIIASEAKMIIQSRNGQATTDQLARGIYSHLIKENLFSMLPSTDIRKVLSQLPVVEMMPNVWSLEKADAEAMLAYVPLTKRIEFIIDSVLGGEAKHGYQLDDFLIPIFTQLKNGLTPESKDIMSVLKSRAEIKRGKWYPISTLFPETVAGTKPVLPEDELREHEQFIYQLARLGGTLGYQIWVGRNEQNKSDLLQRLSARTLEIPGLSEKFISENRIDQIDLLWLKPDEGKYAAFEIENSTGVVPGIQRLANLTGKLPHLVIPTYIVIPDKLRKVARKIFDSVSGQLLDSKQRQVIRYSNLLRYVDLLQKKMVEPAELLDSISEAA